MDRVIYSNLICIVGLPVNFALMFINWFKDYDILFLMNFIYMASTVVCIYLNSRRQYLAARISLLCLVFMAIFISCAVQGPNFEIEHFFIPFAMLSFCIFYAEERKYSFIFLALGILGYAVFVSRTSPILNIDPDAGRYTADDLFSNRVGYLVLTFCSLVALSNAFNRALNLINEQRSKLFEERRMASIGMIAFNVAHEINSPLAALDLHIFQLNAQTAAGNIDKQQLRDKLSRMSGISKRISTIVRGMKFLSGQGDNDPQSNCEIGTVLEMAIDLCRERLKNHGIQFDVQLENKNVSIPCRPISISQVFLNLLNNSIDAVETLPLDSRKIKIESVTIGDRLQVSIEDGGSMSADVKTNLFRNFYTTKEPGRGMGLGLSISKTTVEQHGGSIQLDGQSPSTRFLVRLPLHEVVL